MDELLQVERLNNDEVLFEREFNNLKDFYILDSEKEIHDFIKINPGIILLLNEFESLLKQYFPDGHFELKFGPDLSGTWFDLLELNIWIDEETFNNGSSEHVRSINKQFRPLRRKLDLLGEVLISKRILR
jgi:hypothetical protein